MKTVRDAVIALNGDLTELITRDGDYCLFVHGVDGDYLVDDTDEEEWGYKYISTVEAFNTYVDSLSHHAGKELFQQYLAADKTLLEKECKTLDHRPDGFTEKQEQIIDKIINKMISELRAPLTKETKVDYTSEEFWKDAPEGATHYAKEDLGSFFTYFKGITEGSHYKFNVLTGRKWVYVEYPIHPKRKVVEIPQPKPVFTQEMSDNGELIEVGMMVIVSDEYSDVWGDSLHLVGCPVQVMAVFDGLGMELSKSIPMVSVSNTGGSSACFRADMCKPLDNRTDKEKAIDDVVSEYGGFANMSLDILSIAYDKWVTQPLTVEVE